MTIEEIQALPYGEICTRLAALAPQVLEAQKAYSDLCAEQRVYIGARALHNVGLRIGAPIRVMLHDKSRTALATVVGTHGDTLVFQVLRKDGQPSGKPRPDWDFASFEKI